MKKFTAFGISMLCLFVKTLSSQTLQTDSTQTGYLKVFLDGAYQYHEYLKQEVTYLNYVRDRFDAQVHILITSQQTGSGGTEFTIHFLGQKEFEGKNDTLLYVSNSINTDEEIRSGIEQEIKMGLMPYIAKMPNPVNLQILFQPEIAQLDLKETDDKWHNWVYTIGGSGNASLENLFQTFYYGMNISATKVTDNWKMDFGVGLNENKYKFIIGENIGDTIVSINNSIHGNAIVVKSLNDHWSTGFESYYEKSTYSNYDHRITFSPAIEYDFFPYSESTSRLLSIFYSISPEYADYTDTTIFNFEKEFLISHSLDASLSVTQKWGSISTGAGASNYFHDFTKNKFFVFGNISWRIYEGISFSAYFSYNIIHDQLNLPKAGASDEDILLQQKELSKSYSLFTFFSLSYSFGSIYNNTVNPRFQSSSYFF